MKIREFGKVLRPAAEKTCRNLWNNLMFEYGIILLISKILKILLVLKTHVLCYRSVVCSYSLCLQSEVLLLFNSCLIEFFLCIRCNCGRDWAEIWNELERPGIPSFERRASSEAQHAHEACSSSAREFRCLRSTIL